MILSVLLPFCWIWVRLLWVGLLWAGLLCLVCGISLLLLISFCAGLHSLILKCIHAHVTIMATPKATAPTVTAGIMVERKRVTGELLGSVVGVVPEFTVVDTDGVLDTEVPVDTEGAVEVETVWVCPSTITNEESSHYYARTSNSLTAWLELIPA